MSSEFTLIKDGEIVCHCADVDDALVKAKSIPSGDITLDIMGAGRGPMTELSFDRETQDWVPAD